MILPSILAALVATGLLGADTVAEPPPPASMSETTILSSPAPAPIEEAPVYVARAGSVVIVAIGAETRVVAVPETAVAQVVALEGVRVLVTHRTDFDLDGDVDQGDLQIFLLFYGLPVGDDELRGNSDRYDIDRSGRVDAADWTILRTEHGDMKIEIPASARVASEVPIATRRKGPSP